MCYWAPPPPQNDGIGDRPGFWDCNVEKWFVHWLNWLKASRVQEGRKDPDVVHQYD